MNLFRQFIRRIMRSIPYIRATNFLRAQLDRTNPYFVGWGMTTRTYPPWHQGTGDIFSRSFYETNEEFVAMVREGSFNLTQVSHLNVDGREEFVRGLSWRHFMVQWSVLWAARASCSSGLMLVECGVCDGMTSYFAMRALHGKFSFRCSLYDAWAGMKAEELLTSEKDAIGSYSYLSIETTKKNLMMFNDNCSFIQGSIPGSLSSANVSFAVNWMHLDLNSAIPTQAALNIFWDLMPSGAVVLIDDYLGEPETKNVCDIFFADRKCVVLPLPTGQGIAFKK